MTAASIIVLIDLIDEKGYPNGRSIPVEISYIDTANKSYGEDADGRRGIPLASREIIDVEITHGDLMTMNSNDIEYVIDEARYQFFQRR